MIYAVKKLFYKRISNYSFINFVSLFEFIKVIFEISEEMVDNEFLLHRHRRTKDVKV